jgi:hypothetical protein
LHSQRMQAVFFHTGASDVVDPSVTAMAGT